jgi:aminopeptidase N
MMVAGDDERVIEQAISDFDKAKSVENLSPNLRWLSLLAKVRCDESDKLVDELTERYHSTPSSDVRDDIGVALCVSRQLATIKKLLQTSLNKDIVRLQDTAHWVIGLMRNRRFTDIAWQYYRDNWDWFEREMGDDKRYADFPRYMASALCTEQQLAEFKEFFGPMANQPALKRNIEVGIREIEERVSLITSEAPKVREYLSKYLDS